MLDISSVAIDGFFGVGFWDIPRYPTWNHPRWWREFLALGNADLEGKSKMCNTKVAKHYFFRIHILPDSLHQNQFTTYHKLLTLDVFLKWEAHWLLYCWETSRQSGQYIRSSKLWFFLLFGVDSKIDIGETWMIWNPTGWLHIKHRLKKMSNLRSVKQKNSPAKAIGKKKVLHHRFKSLVSHWWNKRPDFWNQNMGGICMNLPQFAEIRYSVSCSSNITLSGIEDAKN